MAAAQGIATLKLPQGLEDASWDATGADYSGYSPCAALTWVVVTVKGPSPSSPYAILLFHRGMYLGTATATQYGFSPKIVRTNPSTIAVTYTYAQGTDSNADPTGRAHASYSWNSSTGKVDMTGNTPPSQ